jgi:hypothetical protein
MMRLLMIANPAFPFDLTSPAAARPTGGLGAQAWPGAYKTGSTMNNADKVYKALMKCRGAFATIRAVADIAGIDERAARKCLVALDEVGAVDVVLVLDDKHGARRHRCNAYMLVIDNG